MLLETKCLLRTRRSQFLIDREQQYIVVEHFSLNEIHFDAFLFVLRFSSHFIFNQINTINKWIITRSTHYNSTITLLLIRIWYVLDFLVRTYNSLCRLNASKSNWRKRLHGWWQLVFLYHNHSHTIGCRWSNCIHRDSRRKYRRQNHFGKNHHHSHSTDTFGSRLLKFHDQHLWMRLNYTK